MFEGGMEKWRWRCIVLEGVRDKDETWVVGGILWDGKIWLIIKMIMIFMIVSE